MKLSLVRFSACAGLQVRPTIFDRFRLAATFLALVGPALIGRAEEPFHLDRIGVVRFARLTRDTLRRETGVMFFDGKVKWQSSVEEPGAGNAPDSALNRPLVSLADWQAYERLGSGSLVNFDGDGPITVGAERFFAVWPSATAFHASGRLANFSVRVRLAAGADGFTAGFVVAEQPRAVLIRAVGPGLARFGVGGFAADPRLVVQQGPQSIAGNDDWSDQAGVDLLIAAAGRVGAFPLESGSRDAARLLILPPGAYSVRVEQIVPNVTGDEVLLEIYTVPDDIALPRAVSPEHLALTGSVR
jgi:hypothetical protein